MKNKQTPGVQTELIPAPKPKNKRGNKAINLNQLLNRKYKEVDLGEYTKVLGEIEGKCLITVYGQGAGGKSTWVLNLVNYLAEKYGKALYDSHEESFNRTLQSRAKGLKNRSQKLYFTPGLTHQERLERILKLKYRVVVIDSIQFAQFTYQQLIEMRTTFAKRNIIFILVSHGPSLGKLDADNKILYASDIKIYFSGGKLTSLSRYLSKPYYEALFNPNATQGIQLETIAQEERTK